MDNPELVIDQLVEDKLLGRLPEDHNRVGITKKGLEQVRIFMTRKPEMFVLLEIHTIIKLYKKGDLNIKKIIKDREWYDTH